MGANPQALIDQLSFIFSLLAIYAVVIIGVLVWRSTLPKAMQPIVYLFMVALISFLLLDRVPGNWIFEVVVSIAFLLPFSIWQLSRAIFSEETLPPVKLVSYSLIILLWYHACAYAFSIESMSVYATVLMRMTTIGFLILSVVESQRGKKDDLVKSRIELRKIFIYFVAITGLITVLTETSLGTTDLLTLKMFQRGAIMVFASYFLIVNSRWQDGFFAKKSQNTVVKNEAMINHIKEVMADQQYYKTEGLTIGQLAKKLEEQEYKLRAVINQEMGYRNFPAFVNTFRIEEAKTLLQAQGSKALTIQEIAYEVGFSSIGPFNRAFKAATGHTPKEFRDGKTSNHSFKT